MHFCNFSPPSWCDHYDFFHDCLDSRILIKVSSSSIIPYLFHTESTSNMLTPKNNSLTQKKHNFYQCIYTTSSMFNVTSSQNLKKKKRPEAELWEMTEAVADALQRAELRLMERAELGVASESSMGALGSMAASMAEVGGWVSDGWVVVVMRGVLVMWWVVMGPF